MAAPGWYPDPYGQPLHRYWDGQQWGEAVPLLASQQATQVVQGPNHVLHLLLSVVTCGLWLPVWLIIALGNKKQVRYVR